MSKRIFGLFILAALLLPVAAKADSVSPGWEFTSVNSQRSSSNVYTFGIVFTANSDMWVNYLGYYDPTGGMNYTHLVGLFDVTTETLLAYTTVTSDSDYSSAHFLYNAITPVELLNGDEYVLEGVSGDLNGTDYYTNNVSGFAVNAPITINGANYQINVVGGLSFDSSTGSPNYYGPDFGLTPEPNSLWLLGSGLAGLAGLIKRKLMA